MRPARLLALLLLLPGTAGAQTQAADMARGNAARLSPRPPAALAAYTAAIAADSMNGTAYWKAALTLLDMGELAPDSVPSAERDSQYAGPRCSRGAPSCSDPGGRRLVHPRQRRWSRGTDQEHERTSATGGSRSSRMP